MKKYKINTHIYPQYMMLVYADSTLEAFIKLGLDCDTNIESHVTLQDDRGRIFIIFTKEVGINAGIIAHEACHAVYYMFKRLNIHHNADYSENYCYMVQYLVNFITQKNNENKTKITK